eukprot:s74_g10.t2
MSYVDVDYYEGFCTDSLPAYLWRRIGFTQRPCHAQLVHRTQLEVRGTLLAARKALEHGMAGNLAGGTHHAHRAYGSGYTALNDLAITAKVLLQEEAVARLLICDLDVHQGDGTAEILKDWPNRLRCVLQPSSRRNREPSPCPSIARRIFPSALRACLILAMIKAIGMWHCPRAPLMLCIWPQFLNISRLF